MRDLRNTRKSQTWGHPQEVSDAEWALIGIESVDALQPSQKTRPHHGEDKNANRTNPKPQKPQAQDSAQTTSPPKSKRYYRNIKVDFESLHNRQSSEDKSRGKTKYSRKRHNEGEKRTKKSGFSTMFSKAAKAFRGGKHSESRE
jgi:hypothetical protein